MQQRKRGNESTGESRKLGRRGFDLVEQLAAINGSEWSVAGILDEVLPEQRNLWEARCLLRPTHYGNNVSDSKKPLGASVRNGRCKRGGSVEPIRAALNRPSTSTLASQFLQQPLLAIHADKYTSLRTPDNRFRGHLLTLWEDKFRQKSLAVEDILFLISCPNVASTLESASFLRATQMSYEQVMELEMASMMLREEQQEWFHSAYTQATTTSLCDKLARNAWIHGRALRAGSITLPEVIVSKRLPSRPALRMSPVGRRLEKPIALSKRPLQTHSRYISTAPKPLDATTALANGCPLNIQDWIRDHCMEEVARSTTMRKRFAAEKLSNIMSTYYHQVTNRRFMHWRQQALWTQCHRQVRNFCRLYALRRKYWDSSFVRLISCGLLVLIRKCALWVLQRSRTRLESLVFRLWAKWMADTVHQREYEAIAAAVSVQCWFRGVKGKQAAAVHHLHQAATVLQAHWRGYHSRKMYKRKKRFLAYDRAAHKVQRYYYSYTFRVRCALWMVQQRAARVITRAFKHYLEKKRDFIAWCHHLARFHAAISIQIWMRRTKRRIARARAKRDNLARARHVLFKFFRYTQFMRLFGLRVETVSKQRTAAAVLLQNAYRAKQARARFYELKVRLEDQRRQDILTRMWNNAYATTIQKWWRKLRLKLK